MTPGIPADRQSAARLLMLRQISATLKEIQQLVEKFCREEQLGLDIDAQGEVGF